MNAFDEYGKDKQPKFIRKERTEGDTYEIYKGRDAESAKKFLMTKQVKETRYYIVVETPEGNWGKDVKGLYLERLLPWQTEISLAQCEGHVIAASNSLSGLTLVAKGLGDNFIAKVQCGKCKHDWLDGVRYQNVTIVRCPKCKVFNKIDTKNIFLAGDEKMPEWLCRRDLNTQTVYLSSDISWSLDAFGPNPRELALNLIRKYGEFEEVCFLKEGHIKIKFIRGKEAMLDSTVTQFRWGYLGTGPTRLFNFLNVAGFDISQKEVSNIDQNLKEPFTLRRQVKKRSMSRRTKVKWKRGSVKVQAFNEEDARKTATEQLPTKASITKMQIVQKGSQGFMGIGRKPHVFLAWYKIAQEHQQDCE